MDNCPQSNLFWFTTAINQIHSGLLTNLHSKFTPSHLYLCINLINQCYVFMIPHNHTNLHVCNNYCLLFYSLKVISRTYRAQHYKLLQQSSTCRSTHEQSLFLLLIVVKESSADWKVVENIRWTLVRQIQLYPELPGLTITVLSDYLNHYSKLVRHKLQFILTTTIPLQILFLYIVNVIKSLKICGGGENLMKFEHSTLYNITNLLHITILLLLCLLK